MPIDENTTFEISTRGAISAAVVERAKDRLERVGSHCRDAVLHAELRITDDAAHPDEDHARAEATLSVKRGPVRAHAQAPTVGEAVDLMIERLRRRVDRHESRHRPRGAHRDHGDDPTPSRPPSSRTNSAATVVRRKTFAAAPMSIEEAAFDLDILDHDFYLFEEVASGHVGLLSLHDDGTYQLEIPRNATVGLPPGMSVERIDGPALYGIEGAQQLLDSGDDRFVFFRADAGELGQVMYRRYDGNYGIVEVADASGMSPPSK